MDDTSCTCCAGCTGDSNCYPLYVCCPSGPTGPTGPTGPGQKCSLSGELVTNGGMEDFTGIVPAGWTSSTPALVLRQASQGSVHSGKYAVNLKDGSVLTQMIDAVSPGCYYAFSFFAQGEGAQVGFTADLHFLTGNTEVTGAEISVRQQDLPDANRQFAYYRILTIAAPDDVTGARIDFKISASGNQSLNLDDVSFGTQ